MARLQFLFDENISRELGLVAAEEGFDIAFQVDRTAGMGDEAVLAAAGGEDRIVVTEDTDFGRLVFAGSARPTGVILIRIPPWKPEARRERFRWLLREEKNRLVGSFAVLGEHSLRVRAIDHDRA